MALLPGEYAYTAVAEGYVSVENVPFTVTGDVQPLLLSFALEAVPEETPAETPAPEETPAETPAPEETPAETPVPAETSAETNGEEANV